MKAPSYETLLKEHEKMLEKKRKSHAKYIEKRDRRTGKDNKVRKYVRRGDRKPVRTRKPAGTRKVLTSEERQEAMGKCSFCGHSDLRVIQLHHPSREQRPLEVMPLCANCHVLYHYAMGRTNKMNHTKREVLEALKLITCDT